MGESGESETGKGQEDRYRVLSRDKVRERLKSRQLVVEDVKNKDPLVILRDVLSANSDED